ncbi:hypothetical protein GBF38_019190, partial [Nibea albiflora]
PTQTTAAALTVTHGRIQTGSSTMIDDLVCRSDDVTLTAMQPSSQRSITSS